MTTHQFAAPIPARTPAGVKQFGPGRAKAFQQRRDLPATPRTGLALLGNDNNLVAKAAPVPAQAVKPAQPQLPADPVERPPPPPAAYEAPFEWEFLPDTADWLSLIGRLGSCGLPFGGSGGGGGFGGARDLNDDKENVPPPLPQSPLSSASPSPPSPSSAADHWQESPTRSRRRDDRDCVEICFDIGRIL